MSKPSKIKTGRSETDAEKAPIASVRDGEGVLRFANGSGVPCGKKGRSGPPRDNRNGMRHGMRGSKLPKGCEYIENRVNALRRQMEDAVLETRNEINITDAAAINSILKWERHGMLAAHWLRHEAKNLSVSELLRFSEAIAKASDNRDKAIRLLALDREPESPWATPAVESEEVSDDK